MAQLLGNVAVGTLVNINENSTPVQFYVAEQNYESVLNSQGRVLLVRKDCYDQRQWHTSNVNSYASSAIDSWLNSTYKNMLDAGIRALIGSTKIRYTLGNGNTTMGTLDRAVFLLSAYELGKSESWFNKEGTTLPNATNYQIAKLNGSTVVQWTRSPNTDNPRDAVGLYTSGSVGSDYCALTYGSRPAFTLPSTILVDDSNNITQIPTISTLTAPSLAMVGQSIPLSWTPVSISGFDITYQLQRNADNGGWTTIYTGADASYTDTAGTWTQVQYQVAAVVSEVSGTIGNYTQSSIIPVSNPFALVISGSDGNLGTLTSNVPYTVSSNTGNPISLTRTVNGAQGVTLTVESGFAYNIPIADLPTGTGTIQITASIKNGSETVTKTRTWTYYKTPIDIPSTGGIAQLTQNGQNIWPVTVPDAIEAPAYLGGNLNAALIKLGQAALYTKIGRPKYGEVTVDLSKVKVGDEVLLPYNDVMIPHIVVQIGNPDDSMYDASCNGVWLLRKDCIENGQWNSTNVNTLAGSTIMTTMQGYVTNYGTEVQSAIKTVKIPYITGNQNTTLNNLSNGLECQLFPLSVIECGIEVNQPFGIYSDGAKLSYFLSGTSSNANAKRISNTNWWTRTTYTGSPVYVGLFYANGAWDLAVGTDNYANAQNGIRPAFIMPTTFNQTYYIDSSNNIHPSQEYTQGGSITDVFGYEVPIAQTEIGTYVGTGTAGQSSPNTLTFSFEPKVVFISTKINSTNNTGIFIYDTNAIYFPTSYPTGGSYLATTWQGNQISWYYANATAQLNVSGTTYNYIAIG